MAKKPTQTSRKSRFELLEDRRLLTAWNMEAKFTNNTATNAGSGDPHPTNDGGEAAFGDSATQTAAMLGHSTNNNYGDAASATYHWTPGATDNATSASPWTFGDLSSGPTAFAATTPYSYGAYVVPTSFDNFLTGSGGGEAADGVSQSEPGLAGYSRGDSAVFYNYGNQTVAQGGTGLNGDGGGEAVINPFDSYATIPTGTLLLSSLGAAPSVQFTAPSTGSYTLTSTFTDPYFDPFNGTGGDDLYNEAWAWDTGQGQFLIYKVNAANTSSTLLASGFPEDVAAVNQASVPSIGNTITSGSGLTINSGNVLGSALNSETPYSANYPTSGIANTGLPLVSLGAGGTMGNPNATQPTNTYAYGSGGTWALTNVGTILSPAAADTTGDEYDMTWSVTTTVSLNAGDKIQLDMNPEWMQGNATGDYFIPEYLNASVSSASATPPTVTTSGSTGQTFTLGGSAVAVDSGIVVSSTHTDITGASMQITPFTYQTGDALNFTNQNGISGVYSAGLLTLSGSATPAQYTAALQSVTFSSSSIVKGTRSISVIADDSTSTPTTSNTGTDTVIEAIAAPVVTAHQATKNETAGQTVTVDSAVTVSSFDTDVTGAVVTISTNAQGGDTLHFTNQNGVSGSYSSGTLTLSGSATPAQYQTALQSITYSTTSTSTLTRTISMVVSDSNDTGNVNSNTATTQIVVSAPIAISQLYVNGTAWSAMDTWMASNSIGSATLGYTLLTGANQVKPLPWSSINKIDVQFSGALSGTPSASSFKITGGTGGGGHADVAAISVTSVTSLGGNAYALTLSASLGYNNYIISIASSSTVFGPAVTDANGAGIAGAWTNSSSTFPSGGGLAGSQFNFQIDVLPGDTNQNGTVNSQDTAKTSLLANDKTTGATSASYSPFVDVNGNGTINSQDGAVATTNVNLKTSNITNPSNPSGGLAGGSGFTALALGVQESGQTSGSSTPAVSNVSSPSVAPATTTTVTTSSSGGTGSGSAGSSSGSTSSSHNHGRHAFAATDAAVSDFDLADLWA